MPKVVKHAKEEDQVKASECFRVEIIDAGTVFVLHVCLISTWNPPRFWSNGLPFGISRFETVVLGVLRED